MSYKVFIVILSISSLSLFGCFQKKWDPSLLETNTNSGVYNTGQNITGSTIESWNNLTGVVNEEESFINDDKDFDYKKSEDKEIDELMNYIEKIVDEK